MSQRTSETGRRLVVDTEGNYHVAVTSNGMNRDRWEEHLERIGCEIDDDARYALLHAIEAPTNGVTYHIVIRPSSKIIPVSRITEYICAYATETGWKTPHWEVACLLREMFSNEEIHQMGLRCIITMHKPIQDSRDAPCFLSSDCTNDIPKFDAIYEGYAREWREDDGFAFEDPRPFLMLT